MNTQATIASLITFRTAKTIRGRKSVFKMTNNMKALGLTTMLAAGIMATSCRFAVADILTPPVSQNAWARGCQIVQIIQDHGMVRGSGQVDTNTGEVRLLLGIETDRLDSGPRGKVFINLYDASGAKIGYISSGDIGIPGKNPGTARIEWFDGRVTISQNLARRVAKMDVGVQYTGDDEEWFFDSWTGAIDQAWQVAARVISAAKIIVQLAG